MLDPIRKSKWQKNALNYAKIADLYNLGEKAVICIENVLKKRRAGDK